MKVTYDFIDQLNNNKSNNLTLSEGKKFVMRVKIICYYNLLKLQYFF